MILRLFATAASGLAVAAGPPPTPFAGIPNVTIIPYDVAGGDAAAVRRSINAVRPTDPNDGQRVDGLIRWGYRWRVHRDELGNCVAARDDVVFTATVVVPRLVDADASPELRGRFNRYLQSLLAHEDGHIRNAWNRRGDVAAAINAATCTTANAAASAAMKAISAHDVAYDKATRHGSTTILPFS